MLFLKQSAGHCAPMKTIVNAPAKNTMVKDAAKETVKDATANPTMVKDAAANPLEAILQQMQKQNALLMQRLDNLETQNKELRAQKSPPRSRSCSSPRTPTTRKQPKKKQPANKRKRTPSTPQAAKIRKTIGDAFKARYDKQVLNGSFKGANNLFKVDLFEDCIRPMIVAMQNDEDMDTDGFTYEDIYRMGLDAVKKRQRYIPVLVLLCF